MHSWCVIMIGEMGELEWVMWWMDDSQSGWQQQWEEGEACIIAYIYKKPSGCVRLAHGHKNVTRKGREGVGWAGGGEMEGWGDHLKIVTLPSWSVLRCIWQNVNEVWAKCTHTVQIYASLCDNSVMKMNENRFFNHGGASWVYVVAREFEIIIFTLV